ncbi:unnamed protein product [Rangifer tarandus platyrhynchus]|uniref:Uncharacterized protein n=2 Tax=Rangifer tarandus platyrhynchus TaxID=3082113 RepID=A0ACB0FLM6_RANTA|nr:unnamed protein product [Rangifer tarandus platyrhynchus]CAI9713099.1 unnamed protein product [Rangifer tarandus platyrhynchus]
MRQELGGGERMGEEDSEGRGRVSVEAAVSAGRPSRHQPLTGLGVCSVARPRDGARAPLALGRPNHQGPIQEAAQLLPRHTGLASPEISGPGHLQPGQLGSCSAGAQAQQSSGAPRPRWPQGRVGARSLDTLWPHLIQTSPGSRLHRRRRCFPRTRDRMLC